MYDLSINAYILRGPIPTYLPVPRLEIRGTQTRHARVPFNNIPKYLANLPSRDHAPALNFSRVIEPARQSCRQHTLIDLHSTSTTITTTRYTLATLSPPRQISTLCDYNNIHLNNIETSFIPVAHLVSSITTLYHSFINRIHAHHTTTEPLHPTCPRKPTVIAPSRPL